MLKACWKRVESNLNRFKLSLNIHTTYPLLSKTLNDVDAVWIRRPTFAQNPFNFCWTSVGQTLQPFKRAFRRTHAHERKRTLWDKAKLTGTISPNHCLWYFQAGWTLLFFCFHFRALDNRDRCHRRSFDLQSCCWFWTLLVNRTTQEVFVSKKAFAEYHNNQQRFFSLTLKEVVQSPRCRFW